MNLSEIREKLLDQHANLRQIAGRADGLLEQVRQKKAGAKEALHNIAAELESAFSRHNQEEEMLLKDIISTIDAWGPTRHDLMDYHHTVEHAVLRTTLSVALKESDAMAAADRFEQVLHHLLDHMREEEEHILNANVLCDDCCTIDSFSG